MAPFSFQGMKTMAVPKAKPPYLKQWKNPPSHYAKNSPAPPEMAFQHVLTVM
jgi:hypothetical protein